MNDNYEFSGFDVTRKQTDNSVDDEIICTDSVNDCFGFLDDKKSKKKKKRNKTMKKVHKEMRKLDDLYEMLCEKAGNHENLLKHHSTEIDELNKKYIKLQSDVTVLKKNFRADKFNMLISSENISERKKIAQELLSVEGA